MPAAQYTIEIDAPVADVMAVITDFERYPSFLPEIDSAEILRAEDNSWEVRFSVRVVRRFGYTLRLEQEGANALRWSLVEGAFKANDGSWALEAIDGGTRTRAVYSIDLQVGMFVPGNILRTLVERSLPETVGRFKKEVER
jgi:uncharacterized membrane protein